MRSELQKRGGCFCDGFNWLNLRFFEVARVLVRLDHTASVIEIGDRIILPWGSLLIWQAEKSNNGVTFLVRRSDR